MSLFSRFAILYVILFIILILSFLAGFGSPATYMTERIPFELTYFLHVKTPNSYPSTFFSDNIFLANIYASPLVMGWLKILWTHWLNSPCRPATPCAKDHNVKGIKVRLFNMSKTWRLHLSIYRLFCRLLALEVAQALVQNTFFPFKKVRSLIAQLQW